MKPGGRFADPEVQSALIEINPEHKLRKYALDKFGDKLHRLDPSRPAWTVTAHLQKDCYKFIHHSQPRTITVREAARLQSFPDWFDFDDLKLGPAYRLIGNAVPPKLAQAFAQSFLEADPLLTTRLREHTPALINDEVWSRLESIVQSESRSLGRRPLQPRQIISGILYVLQTGIPWDQLPPPLGFGSGSTCRTRLSQWKRTGLWYKIEAVIGAAAEERSIGAMNDVKVPEAAA
jgi:transposase